MLNYKDIEECVGTELVSLLLLQKREAGRPQTGKNEETSTEV